MSQMQFPIQSQQSAQLTDSQQPQQRRSAGGTNASQLYPTRNYLSQNVRQASVAALNQALADVASVNMQCKTAHWNVRGSDFYQLHELFEEIVEDFDEHVDTIAERATALGGQAMGTPGVVAQQCSVPSLSPTTSDQGQLLEQVANSLAALDASLYDQINRVSERGDLDTADLLNEVSRDVSQSLWFVESHLQGSMGTQQTGQQGLELQGQRMQGKQMQGMQLQAQQ